MSFILQFTTTKPAAVAWREAQTVPGPNNTNITTRAWSLSQPGVLSTVNVPIDANTVVAYLHFTDQAAADAYIIARDAMPEFQARAAYRVAHGMTMSLKKFRSIA